MSPGAVAAILGAGLVAGAINAAVGSGSMITFPTLLAAGYPPVLANVSNTVGLVPGTVSGAIGYRRELAGQRRVVMALAVPALAGGILGAVLLLVLPQSVFHAVVPILILAAVVLVVVQPRLSRWLAGRGEHRGDRWLLWAGIFGTGIYGGYFGAAQGVIMIGIMGLLLAEPLQTINGIKNVLAGVINGAAAVYFIFASHVAWLPAGLLAVSSLVGAQVGAAAGRRLPPVALRVVIVIAGLAAIAKLLL